MPCIPGPKVDLPTLPAPLTLGLPEANLGPVTINICCVLPPFTTPPLVVPIPPVILNPGIIATFNGKVQMIQAFLDKFQHDCPRE